MENAAALGGFGGGATSGGGLLAGGPLQFPGGGEIHHAPQELQCWPQPPQAVHQPPDLTSAPPPHQTDKHVSVSFPALLPFNI